MLDAAIWIARHCQRRRPQVFGISKAFSIGQISIIFYMKKIEIC